MKTHSPDRRPRAFALVVTICLMVLLSLIAIGLLGLSAVTLRTAGQGEDLAIAQANARLALLMAIGELQKSLGPDKAVTATSEIAVETPAKRHATGVWQSWDYDPNNPSLNYDKEKADRFRAWLVSSADPAEVRERDFVKVPWTGETTELFAADVVGSGGASDDPIVAGTVPVWSDGKLRGAYAWHVSDESVKARVNLLRDPGQNQTLAQKRALLAGQRPDPSVLKADDGTPLDFLPSDDTVANHAEAVPCAAKMSDLDQVELLPNAKDRIKPFRNDLTAWSLGVMADVRRGGLKQDLTSLFEAGGSLSNTLPAEFKDKGLYESTHGITGVSDPFWSTLSGYYNTYRGIATPDSAPTYSKAPSKNLSLSDPAPPTTYYPGPVIAKVEVLFNFVTRDSHSCWVSALKSVDPSLLYMGHLTYTPLVTLHNPYNINISFDSLQVIIRNVPIAFRFYVNGVAQNSCLVSLTELFVNTPDRNEKSFALNIANWTAPGSTSTSGPIVMKPGQTLICGPYLNPASVFGGGNGSSFFDFENNLTGYKISNGNTTVNPITAKPGYVGRGAAYDIDWLTPTHNFQPPAGSSNDGNLGILGLRAADKVYMEYAVQQPTLGLNTAFQVTARLSCKGVTIDYGGLNFQYEDGTTLSKFFNNKVYRFPSTGEMNAMQAYVPNTEPISMHAAVKSVAIFSAYARTANGGVYETNKRTETPGSLNVLRDGRLAGKPFLFHNPARAAITVNLKTEKPCIHSHELNFQPLPGHADDILEIDPTNRTNSLTANTTLKGIKSGTYLELPTGPMQTLADFRRSNALTSSYLPNFVQPVSSSLVHPLMSTTKVVQTDQSVAAYALLDHSVLANHALYDRFYFSTIAMRGAATPDTVFDDFMEGKVPLASQAFRPYRPGGKTIAAAKQDLFASGKPKETAYQSVAEYQMIQGPFNVNSTSVAAWKAMLASLNKNEVTVLWAKNGGLSNIRPTRPPVMAMSLPNAGPVSGGVIDTKKIDNTRTNEWDGYRELDEAALDELAKRIVEQVRARGPFLSLSEFVNRRIGPESETTRSGALEVAISKARLNDKVFASQVPVTLADLNNANLYNYKTPQVSVGNPAAGAPGWICQGDLMRIIEPAATVRADTFLVRVCGEARGVNGNVTARAYAEAVVQRFPDYVDPANRASVNVYTSSDASPMNKVFGHCLRVVSFRWLSSREV